MNGTTSPAGAAERARRGRNDWSGLLRVDKPVGVTSHDVVDRVRRRLRVTSVGHLGTLDPGASGLLLMAIGSATRCATVWQGGAKTYEGTVHFGVVTTTQDLTGDVLERHPVSLDPEEIRAATAAFTGDIEQVPPMVSALKRGGQRLHRLARRGIEVAREPRPIHVAEWTWAGFDLPHATFRIRCSGGTYVRTLAHDLGARLGCGAALEALRRLRSEPFGVEGAVGFRDLDTRPPEAIWTGHGMPLERALEGLPTARLEPAAVETIGYGGRPALAAEATAGLPRAAGPRSVVFADPDGRVIALGELLDDADGVAIACPHVVFPWAVREGRA